MAEENNDRPVMGDVHKISQTYEGDPIDGQHPIAKIDVDIIQLLITACYNNGVDEIGDILTSYKTLATDDQIRADLRELCSKGVGGDQEYKNKVFKDMVDINGTFVDVRFVSIIKPIDFYDSKKTRMTYAIVINPDPAERLFHPNTVIDCGTRAKRDQIIEDMREKLRKFTTIRIL